MQEPTDIRSWCNPVPGWPREVQRAQLTGEIYEASEKDYGEKREALIHSVRKGSAVEVCDLFLLAIPIGRSDARRRDLLKAVDTIEDRGGFIIERSTGRRSDVGRDWRQMQADAFEKIGRSAQGRRSAANGKGSKGRPLKWDLTPVENEIGAGIWGSRQLHNDKDRLAALEARLGKKLKRGWCWNRWGSPGKVKVPEAELPKVPKKRSPKDYVYFILFSPHIVKIGHSVDPRKAMNSMQRGCHHRLELLGVCDGGAEREGRLHKKFRSFKAGNGGRELFRFVPEIKQYVKRFAKKLSAE